MKKSDLVKVIVTEVDGITAEKAGKVINVLFEAIGKALAEGDSYNHPCSHDPRGWCLMKYAKSAILLYAIGYKPK